MSFVRIYLYAARNAGLSDIEEKHRAPEQNELDSKGLQE